MAMKQYELLTLLNEGWILERKTINLTEFRTLIKESERKKGIPQSIVAQCSREALIVQKYNSNVWELSSWGKVVVENFTHRGKKW